MYALWMCSLCVDCEAFYLSYSLSLYKVNANRPLQNMQWSFVYHWFIQSQSTVNIVKILFSGYHSHWNSAVKNGEETGVDEKATL